MQEDILKKLKLQLAEYTLKIEKTEQDKKDQMAVFKEILKDLKDRQLAIAEAISSNTVEPLIDGLGQHWKQALGLYD
jgi:hypothetical protein